MMRRVTAYGSILMACLGLALPARGDEAALQITGSVSYETGYLAVRDELPDELTRDWYARTQASARFTQRGETARFALEAWTQYDAAAGAWEVSLDEAWVELRAAILDLRLGRAPVQFGPCLAFNPANSLVARDSFTPRSGSVGFDGLFMELRPFPAGGGKGRLASLVVDAALLLPGAAVASTAEGFPDIDESSAHVRFSFYLPGSGILGPTEVGFSGDARRLGGNAPESGIPMAGGAWLSADLAGFVLGAEGSIRSPGYDELSMPGGTSLPATAGSAGDEPGYLAAASLNRRAGDFFVVLEAGYEYPDDDWLLFSRLSWASDDFEASASGLYDARSSAARTALDLAWNASDFLVPHLRAAWNHLPAEWEPALATDFSVGLGLTCFY